MFGKLVKITITNVKHVATRVEHVEYHALLSPDLVGYLMYQKL